MTCNDPGKLESNLVCYEAIRFPHIVGMFSFLHRQYINLQKVNLRDKTQLNSILKGRFLVFKDFDHSYQLQTIPKKSLPFQMVLVKKLFEIVRINIHAASRIRSKVQIIVKLSPFRYVPCRCCLSSYLDRSFKMYAVAT